MQDDRFSRWITWGLLASSALLLAPLLPPVMVAIWFAALTRRPYERLRRILRGRARLSAALTLLAFSLLVAPFVAVATSLAADAYELVVQLLRSPRGKQAFEQLVAHGGSPHSPSSLWDLAVGQQERAWALLRQVAGTATRIVIDLVVILAGAYSVLLEGDRAYAWFEAHAPISPALLRRLRDAFFETGRGLFIGIGGAGLMQAIVATLAYLLLRVPSALELGALTFCFSIVPVVGTAIVWVPVAAGLALTGRTVAALILAICGVAVIGTVDNLVRPMLARRGHLRLPTYIVLVSMFAGVELIGPWGLLVAPLAVRLTKAALEPGGDENRREQSVPLQL